MIKMDTYAELHVSSNMYNKLKCGKYKVYKSIKKNEVNTHTYGNKFCHDKINSQNMIEYSSMYVLYVTYKNFTSFAWHV